MSACCCEVSPPEFGGPIPDRECPIHGQSTVTADHAGERKPWPCDDYRAPLTCWTVPSGRKTLICAGCRDAFPDGAETQALYQDALRERVEALADEWRRDNGPITLRHADRLRALLVPEPSERA